ncbi:MAG: DUF3793 family protein [Clostridiales bacterium]|nr:DUF3793 family protein [Clostridiales bacterium]
MLERQLVEQCSPTLAGIKTGSLFTLHHIQPECIKHEVQRLNRLLYGKGLLLVPLKSTSRYTLLYLYRPYLLAKDLGSVKSQALLKKFGYSSSLPSSCLVRLIRRLKESDGFPHEIGLFLGYPPEDVQGFIKNPHCPSRCRSCGGGCWKVYHDPKQAQALFKQYARCTKTYKKRLLEGASFEKLVVAV